MSCQEDLIYIKHKKSKNTSTESEYQPPPNPPYEPPAILSSRCAGRFIVDLLTLHKYIKLRTIYAKPTPLLIKNK